MRYMIIVKATPDSEAERMPPQPVFDAMADYHEALSKAGVLVDAGGLKPSKYGFRIRFDGKRKTVVDGPFAETKELLAGYTVINVKDEDEAREWAARFPNPHGEVCEIELRPFYEAEDFEAQAVDLQRFRDIGGPFAALE
ncbi:MAG TPA: YciI family protein [Reyranella sp.]|nr:YciI family protein [Reyranella sp.]